MVPLAILRIGTNCTIGRANSTICITIGTNGITNRTIDKTLNDIGIPLVPLGNPEHTICMTDMRMHGLKFGLVTVFSQAKKIQPHIFLLLSV